VAFKKTLVQLSRFKDSEKLPDWEDTWNRRERRTVLGLENLASLKNEVLEEFGVNFAI
jgi:hypothetical protein